MFVQVENVIKNIMVEIEVFGFGSFCVMNEGCCWFFLYVCGELLNIVGVCLLVKYVKWDKKLGVMEICFNGILIDCFGDDELVGYFILCKGCFEVEGEIYYVFEELISLNVLFIFLEIIKIGVCVIKVEGCQCSLVYVIQVICMLCVVLDLLVNGSECFQVKVVWQIELVKVFEGSQVMFGVYNWFWC